MNLSTKRNKNRTVTAFADDLGLIEVYLTFTEPDPSKNAHHIDRIRDLGETFGFETIKKEKNNEVHLTLARKQGALEDAKRKKLNVLTLIYKLESMVNGLRGNGFTVSGRVEYES